LTACLRQNILLDGSWGAYAMIRGICFYALAAIAAAQPVAAIADAGPITVQGQALSKWKEAESDHFKIYSDGDDKYLNRLSGRLEAVHYLLKIATGMKQPADENIVKVKVYAVGDIAIPMRPAIMTRSSPVLYRLFRAIRVVTAPFPANSSCSMNMPIISCCNIRPMPILPGMSRALPNSPEPRRSNAPEP
jgi:hypothetical protein